MTFCVGIRVKKGLIALADTEVVKGVERVSKGKLTMLSVNAGFVWTMTSGLRSVRDKTLTYTENSIRDSETPCKRTYEIANLFGDSLRRVRKEDGTSLSRSNLRFNLNAIIGGRLDDDDMEKMYFVYPEGNWIEASIDSPYFLIGRSYYAKPILDRLLSFELDLPQAAALAYLGFDATRRSVFDVDFPIDVAICDSRSGVVSQQRLTAQEMEPVDTWWHKQMSQALGEFPTGWLRPTEATNAAI